MLYPTELPPEWEEVAGFTPARVGEKHLADVRVLPRILRVKGLRVLRVARR